MTSFLGRDGNGKGFIVKIPVPWGMEILVLTIKYQPS